MADIKAGAAVSLAADRVAFKAEWLLDIFILIPLRSTRKPICRSGIGRIAEPDSGGWIRYSYGGRRAPDPANLPGITAGGIRFQ
jgi:hypothetical protein